MFIKKKLFLELGGSLIITITLLNRTVALLIFLTHFPPNKYP